MSKTTIAAATLLREPFIVTRHFPIGITTNPKEVGRDIDKFIRAYLEKEYVGTCYMSSLILSIEKILSQSGLIMHSTSISGEGNINVNFAAKCLVLTSGSVIVDNKIIHIDPNPKAQIFIKGRSELFPGIGILFRRNAESSFVGIHTYGPAVIANITYPSRQKAIQVNTQLYSFAPKIFNVIAPLPTDTLTSEEQKDYAAKKNYAQRLLTFAKNSYGNLLNDLIPKVFKEDTSGTAASSDNEIEMSIAAIDLTAHKGSAICLNYGQIANNISIRPTDLPEQPKESTRQISKGSSIINIHCHERGLYVVLTEYIHVLHIIVQFAELYSRDESFANSRGLWLYYKKK